jgi:hypothetical protein
MTWQKELREHVSGWQCPLDTITCFSPGLKNRAFRRDERAVFQTTAKHVLFVREERSAEGECLL